MENDSNTTVLSVLETVATAERVDPVDLPPLSETIDPAALNGLFRSATDEPAPVTVRFEYCGYEITVQGSDSVSVEPATPSATPVGSAASAAADPGEGPLAD